MSGGDGEWRKNTCLWESLQYWSWQRWLAERLQLWIQKWKAVANISIKSVGVTVIGISLWHWQTAGKKNRLRSYRGKRSSCRRQYKTISGWLWCVCKVVIYHAWDTKSGGLVSAGEADDIYVHNQDWIIGYEDDEQTVMYYTKPRSRADDNKLYGRNSF